MLRYKFNETMKGYIHLKESPEKQRDLIFNVDCFSKSILSPIFYCTLSIDGRITIEGLVENAAISGTLDVDLIYKKVLVYDFSFKDKDDNQYRFVGKKHIKLTNFFKTITTCYATLYKNGSEYGFGVVYFDLKKDLVKFVLSFKPVS